MMEFYVLWLDTQCYDAIQPQTWWYSIWQTWPNLPYIVLFNVHGLIRYTFSNYTIENEKNIET